ncbi:MAG: hypothetical protein SFV51_16765 [Bryobacteraceae bacterium]|nr:hypothetical protein [Bryobacteraceae bacterium]
MKLRLDPWPADYEAPIQIDESAPPTSFHVNAAVETTNWRAIPAGAAEPRPCRFVDGVRRVEARVLADHDGALVHGLFGSLAAGAVAAGADRAAFDFVDVERYLILGSGQQRDASPCATIHFAARSMPENTPNAVLGELQSLMRAAESRAAERAAAQGYVFVDGLSYRSTSGQNVVGVIKRIFETYLPPAQFNLVESLTPGQRTPLFTIEDGHFDRYSCFLRLSAPRAVDHPLTGIVRIEIGAAIGVDRGVALASFAAATLPRFASTTARDPRAPQNLLPIGALESEMRRRLGDPVTIRRAIERLLHTTAA